MSDISLFRPEVETLTAVEMRALQERKWREQWQYVSASSTFYRRKLARLAGRDMTLDDLRDIETTDKDELRQSQAANYPYGDYIACTPEQVSRIHRTSGTTGQALILANSRRDTEIIAENGARGMWASGLRPTDIVVHCLNYQMWTGGVTDHMILEASGATVLPYGVGNTEQLVKVIAEMGITAISCTPSYPALLEKVLRETSEMKPRDLGLRIALFGGEAGLDNAAFRQGLEETWGFKVRNANFGLSEAMSVLGSQCEETDDLHYLCADTVFFELLEPSTGERVKIEDGATGEMVCTHLEKQCQPLIRYRSRDVLTITGTDKCKCGRSSFRFRVSGRSDDMFNVRGVNVFPTAVQTIIVAAKEETSGHFRILLEGPGPYDRIAIRAEAARGLAKNDWDGAARALEKRIRDAIGASAMVELVAFESYPRTAGKTSLVERV